MRNLEGGRRVGVLGKESNAEHDAEGFGDGDAAFEGLDGEAVAGPAVARRVGARAAHVYPPCRAAAPEDEDTAGQPWW